MMQSFSRVSIFIHPATFLVIFLIALYTAFYLQIAGIVILSLEIALAIVLTLLIHEAGHTAIAAFWNCAPKVIGTPVFVTTIFLADNVGLAKQLGIMSAGIAMNILCGGAAYLIYGILKSFALKLFFLILASTNFVYCLLNILPTLPFDGGHITKTVLEHFFASKGLKGAFILSIIVSFCMLLLLSYLLYFPGIVLFAIYFVQNIQLFRSIRHLSDSDQSMENKGLLFEGEIEWQRGNIAQAKEKFTALLERCKEGYLHDATSEHLAVLLYEEKNIDEAYNILRRLGDNISDKALCLLYDIAYEKKDFNVVCELSERCYKIMTTEIVALNNARAFAHNNDPEAAGGWLSTALEYGNIAFDEILAEDAFKNVKDNRTFLSFFQ